MHLSPALAFSILTALSGVLAARSLPLRSFHSPLMHPQDDKFILPAASISFITTRTANVTAPGPGTANMKGKLKPFRNGAVKTNTNSTPHTLNPEDGNDTWFIAKQPNGSYSVTCSLNGMPQVLISDLTVLLKGIIVRANAVGTAPLPIDATDWDINLVSFNQIPPSGTFDLIFNVCHLFSPLGHRGELSLDRCLTRDPGPTGSVSIQPKGNGAEEFEWVFDFIPIPIAGEDPTAAAAAAKTVNKEGTADDDAIAENEVKDVEAAAGTVVNATKAAVGTVVGDAGGFAKGAGALKGLGLS
ncbi:hypothetical protein B0H16DRAFT_1687776 [Mycena metata]|uniref:Uncharacterized protein n=1 Tax=Mycena metata TaxID=1033252 RepID=A0AAD7DNX9_9AGAR|nr:hypothetical protein B0H16DRAFT_1706490 [Mycena metata]KAJ7764392.1 hypothetical protein B0H16DRAFT_1687776 [Mycena metata]